MLDCILFILLLVCLFIGLSLSLAMTIGSSASIVTFILLLVEFLVILDYDFAVVNNGFSVSDFCLISMSLFCLLLLFNILGLLDLHCVSMILTFTIGLAFLLLRLYEFILWIIFSWRCMYLYVIDLGFHYIPILLFLLVIEIVSNWFRSFSLGFRLFANILSGHLIILMLVGLYLMSLKAMSLFAILLGGIVLFIVTLECFMSIIQAYVFITLFRIYLSDLIV